MLSKKECLHFNIILTLKTIHGYNHRKKIKKPCWQQPPICKSLLPYGHGDKRDTLDWCKQIL